MTTSVSNTSSTSATNATVASGQTGLNTDYNTFLKLLTTQLKNQDPLSPMDANAFTQQLVAMNGVQQQLQTNSLLQQMVNQNSGAGPAVNLIGKTVQASSPTASLNGGSASWTYQLNAQSSSATLNVTDSTGRVIWSQAAPSLDQGQHAFTWNGQTLTGGKVTSGDYTLGVVANDSSLKAVGTNVYIQGVVTGVQNTSTGTKLNLGTTAVDYSSVSNITN